MAAIIEIENEIGEPVTSANFGAVTGGESQQLQFQAKNVGDQDAALVHLSVVQLASNDGFKFAQIAAPDPLAPGNPGVFGASIDVGALVAGAVYVFWGEVAVLPGETPQGNPRNFDIIATYQGA